MSKKVLVVDDDDLFRQGLVSVLEAKGLDVIQADNGEAGLKQASQANVIVTDVQMPGMDGLTMVDKLRQDEKGKELPVIILSVNEEAESLNKALSAGVTVYMSKNNFDIEALAEQIATAVS